MGSQLGDINWEFTYTFQVHNVCIFRSRTQTSIASNPNPNFKELCDEEISMSSSGVSACLQSAMLQNRFLGNNYGIAMAEIAWCNNRGSKFHHYVRYWKSLFETIEYWLVVLSPNVSLPLTWTTRRDKKWGNGTTTNGKTLRWLYTDYHRLKIEHWAEMNIVNSTQFQRQIVKPLLRSEGDLLITVEELYVYQCSWSLSEDIKRFPPENVVLSIEHIL